MFDNNFADGIEARALPSGANEVSSSERTRADSLSLEIYKNNYHSDSHANCYVGHFRGVKKVSDSEYRGIRANLKCKKWDCDYCRPILMKKLKKRIYNGAIANIEKKGFRSRYATKLLTLTYAGKEKRSKTTPNEAYYEMSKNFNKLVRAIRKQYGDFEFLKIPEKHKKDGFPHYHTLIVGKGIIPKEVLDTIRDLWTKKYGMGNVDLKIINSARHGINYIIKYLSKGLTKFGKNTKAYTASKNALEPIKKNEWIASSFIKCGYFTESDDLETFKMELNDHLSESEKDYWIEYFISKVFGAGKIPEETINFV